MDFLASLPRSEDLATLTCTLQSTTVPALSSCALLPPYCLAHWHLNLLTSISLRKHRYNKLSVKQKTSNQQNIFCRLLECAGCLRSS